MLLLLITVIAPALTKHNRKVVYLEAVEGI